MTPLPKKKHAKSRTRTRKAAITQKMPSLVTCVKCGSQRFAHHACPNCGYYGTQDKKSAIPETKKA